MIFLNRHIKVMSALCITDEKLLPWRCYEYTLRIGSIVAKGFLCFLASGMLQGDGSID